MPEDPLQQANAQHMRAMGLDPATLGARYESVVHPESPRRCQSKSALGEQCARPASHEGVHARGHDRWDEDVELPEGFRIAVPKIATASSPGEGHRVDLVDYVAQAMRMADGDHTMGTGALAEVAVDAMLRWGARGLVGDEAVDG